MRRSFDIIIPIAKNDVYSLDKVVPFIKKNISCNKIIVIGNASLRRLYSNDNKVAFIDEDKIIPNMTFNVIRSIISSMNPKAARRSGWYFQQFIKLGYARISEEDYYLSWDSDTYPLKNISFYENNKPIMDFVNKVNSDSIYFDTIKKIWPEININETQKNSYITEHMFFTTDLVNEMLDDIEKNNCPFYKVILKSIDKRNLNLSGFSEFNTYAAYIKWKHSNNYAYRKWHNLRNGKFYIGNSTESSIFRWIGENFEALSVEDYDSQLFLFKTISIMKLSKIIDFNVLYRTFQPLYNVYYKVRLKIRDILKH